MDENLPAEFVVGVVVVFQLAFAVDASTFDAHGQQPLKMERKRKTETMRFNCTWRKERCNSQNLNVIYLCEGDNAFHDAVLPR